MKKLVIFTIVLVMGLFAGSIDAQNKRAKNDADITFSVEIDCKSCQKKIEAKIPFEKGVKDLKVDFEKQTVWILYNSKTTNANNLKDALKKLGYDAKELKKDK